MNNKRIAICLVVILLILYLSREHLLAEPRGVGRRMWDKVRGNSYCTDTDYEEFGKYEECTTLVTQEEEVDIAPIIQKIQSDYDSLQDNVISKVGTVAGAAQAALDKVPKGIQASMKPMITFGSSAGNIVGANVKEITAELRERKPMIDSAFRAAKPHLQRALPYLNKAAKAAYKEVEGEEFQKSVRSIKDTLSSIPSDMAADKELRASLTKLREEVPNYVTMTRDGFTVNLGGKEIEESQDVTTSVPADGGFPELGQHRRDQNYGVPVEPFASRRMYDPSRGNPVEDNPYEPADGGFPELGQHRRDQNYGVPVEPFASRRMYDPSRGNPVLGNVQMSR